MTKKLLGLIEDIEIYSVEGSKKKCSARIDTGATMSSIDVKLASELGLGPIIKTKIVKSSHGTTLRPIIKAKIHMADEAFETSFTIADRSHMKYPILIGQNTMKEGSFLIDPSK